MNPGARPRVSIITATYNWSSVLRCAIASAMTQTFTDFEMVVVGDGCTDDSEAVVRASGDERVRWVNLPENSGGQAAPNNRGIQESSGEYIAYLGHDDLWHPEHVQILIETMERTEVDLACSVAILYGPPGSGVRSVSGVFGGGEFGARDMMVPSSMVHKRSLITRIGGWQEGRMLPLPTDVEFQQRAVASGARIVSCGVLTAFKFNAAWRRHAYRKRSSAEQQQMLARIQSGVDFRQAELVDVLRAVAGDKYVRTEAPQPAEPGWNARYNSRYKGTSTELPTLQRIEERTRFYLDDQLGGFEWHEVEANQEWGTIRWSGPLRMSTLEFPVSLDRPLRMSLRVVAHMQESLESDVQIFVNDEPVAWHLAPANGRDLIMQAVLMPAMEAGPEGQPLSISIQVARTRRSIDLGLNDDRRSLGIAVNWAEFEPEQERDNYGAADSEK